LQEFQDLEDKEFVVLESRGKLERMLNKVKLPKVMLLRSFIKDDDNTFIFAKYGYELGDLSYKKDGELGLSLINEDVYQRMAGHCPRCLLVNAELAQIRWRKLKRMPRNRGSPVFNFFSIKNLYIGFNEILAYAKEQKLDNKSLRKIDDLISAETEYDLARGAETKMGLGVFNVTRILEGIV